MTERQEIIKKKKFSETKGQQEPPPAGIFYSGRRGLLKNMFESGENGCISAIASLLFIREKAAVTVSEYHSPGISLH